MRKQRDEGNSTSKTTETRAFFEETAVREEDGVWRNAGSLARVGVERHHGERREGEPVRLHERGALRREARARLAPVRGRLEEVLAAERSPPQTQRACRF